jgi:hypothetical protein
MRGRQICRPEMKQCKPHWMSIVAHWGKVNENKKMTMRLEELHERPESWRPEFKKSFGKDLVKGNYIAMHHDKLSDKLGNYQNWEIVKCEMA